MTDSRGSDSGYRFNIPAPLTTVYFHHQQATRLLVKSKYFGLEQLQSRMGPDEKGGEPKEADKSLSMMFEK